MLKKLKITTSGVNLYEITDQVNLVLENSKILDGLLVVFIRHTSASLIIQENADPSAKYDLLRWFDRNVPEHDPNFTHTAEGPDDMPSHIKSCITNTSLAIPVADGELCLGTWQGIYLFEHRRQSHVREILIKILAG